MNQKEFIKSRLYGYSKASDTLSSIFMEAGSPGTMNIGDASFTKESRSNYDLYHMDGMNDCYVALVADKKSDIVWMYIGEPMDPFNKVENNSVAAKVKDLNKLEELFVVSSPDNVSKELYRKYERIIDEGEGVFPYLDESVRKSELPYYDEVISELKTYWKGK